MAAMRSALMGLFRRSCANSSVGGRGLEMRQGIGQAAARTPALPSLRPAAVRNLEEGWRCFSTQGMEGADQTKPLLMKHKAESILHMWWQRSRDSLKNIIRDQSILVATTISFAASYCFLKSTICSTTNTRTKPNTFASSTNAFASSTKPVHITIKPVRFRPKPPLPMAFRFMPGYQSIYFCSLKGCKPASKPARHTLVTASTKTKGRS